MANLDLLKPPQEIRELNLLQELEKNPVISQRELSNKFGIALGVTNACLKRMVRKGWIRISGLNRRKIGYFLTPKGFAEKTKLTLNLISWTVQHYSTLKDHIARRFLEMEREGVKRVVFYGVSDEMEVAYVTLQGVEITLIGIVEDEERRRPQKIFGFDLKDVHQIRELNPDAVLITSIIGKEERIEKLRNILNPLTIKIYDISE